MLTAEGKRKRIRVFTSYESLYKIISRFTTDYLYSNTSHVARFATIGES